MKAQYICILFLLLESLRLTGQDAAYPGLDPAQRDSFRNNYPIPEMAELEARMLAEKQQLEIARLEREAARKDLALSEYKRWRNGVLGGALIAILVFIGLYSWFRYRQQEKTTAMERRKAVELQRIDDLKNQFLAATSHELRTPLQSMIGLAESLRERAATAFDRHNLDMIIASGRRLNNLVNDILDFSRIKHGDIRLERKPVDLYSLVEVVLHAALPLGTGKDLQFINQVPRELPAADVDEDRLQQILFNLVGNAIKFTEQGHIRIGARRNSNDFLRLWIEDTGIGIPDDKRDVIFREFEQADGTAPRPFASTGLGLSISKRLIELHGGRMWVHSQMGLGSIFFMTLPLSAAEAQPLNHGFHLTPRRNRPFQSMAAPRRQSRHPEEGPFRILIVEDDPVCQELLLGHLKEGPCVTFTAIRGAKILDLIEAEGPFDLALLDVVLPDISGFEVCRAIRNRYSHLELPVIFISARDRTEELSRGFLAGANDYIFKPFTQDEFLARVHNQLHLHRLYASKPELSD